MDHMMLGLMTEFSYLHFSTKRQITRRTRNKGKLLWAIYSHQNFIAILLAVQESL